MKLHPYPIVIAVMLALAACRPGAAEYSESEARNALTLSDATARIDIRFAAGASRIVGPDAERLRALAASGRITPSDRVLVAAAGGGRLAADRIKAVAAELLRYGIIVGALPVAAVPPNAAVIEIGRHLVTLPPCPNWSRDPVDPFTNTRASNFGCANATNLGLMVASPTDLAVGRPIGLTEAAPAVLAVQRYLTDRIQLPASAMVGPIAGTTTAPAGAGAAPTGATAGSP
jgi:pilus assembly protein CpaD